MKKILLFFVVISAFVLITSNPVKALELPNEVLKLGSSESMGNFEILKPDLTLLSTSNKNNALKVQTAKYALIDNLDLFANEAYYKPIQTMSEYSGNFTSISFDNNTLSKTNLTDFDLIVFPVGDNPLNAATDQTMTNIIVSKINDVIGAGKSIIITGRHILWWAFNSDPNAANGKDPVTIDFLNNKLGLQYINTIPVSTKQGTTVTYTGYDAKGTPMDPVGGTVNKMCNIQVGTPPNLESPLGYYEILDVFKSKDTKTYIDIDHYITGTLGAGSDTLLGVRMTIGKSKVIFLSYGLENIAESAQRFSYLKRMLDWCLADAPKPGSQIEFMQSELQFGSVITGQSGTLSAGFRNTGTEDLIIDSLYIDDSLFGMGGFTITTNLSLPLTIKSGDSSKVDISFQPTDKATYYAALTFVSNSNTGGKSIIDLRGTGVSGDGPRISANTLTINFDKTKPGLKNEQTLKIYNPGTENLIITEALVQPTSAPFFLVGFKKPSVIKPGDSLVQAINFSPAEASKTYNAALTITSNATDMNQFVVALHGESDVAGSVPEYKTSDNSIIAAISPNPVNGICNLKINSDKNSGVSAGLVIFDINGNKTPLNLKFDIFPGENNIQLDLSNLGSGYYVCLITFASGSVYLPVFIEN